MQASGQRQLARWLKQLHAVEQQALFQMRRARRLTGDDFLAQQLERHIAETERHRELVRERLSRLGRRRGSRTLDLTVTVNRVGFLTYTASSPDAPGKLMVDSFAYEFLEIAAYQMLADVAARRGDEATRAMALSILADEQAMAQRLSDGFDRSLHAARRRAHGAVAQSVIAHLRDAHALETQAAVLMGLGSWVAGSPELSMAYRAQVTKTRRQLGLIGDRLRELGSRPGRTKDVGLAAAGAAWSAIWFAQRDTPAKLMCFSFAAVHLEVAAYELLRREAAIARDAETEALAGQLLADEQAAAETLQRLLHPAVEATLGVP